MNRARVIPVLLLDKDRLIKSERFKNYIYVGDPINAVKIFNEKEVDELIILDITATKNNRTPNLTLIEEIASEAFMPLGYGGGISNLHQIQKIIYQGIEKVVINSSSQDKAFIKEAVKEFGSSTIVISVDVKKDLFGRAKVYSNNGKKNLRIAPELFCKEMEDLGVGEIFLNNIDLDGTMKGYDIDLIKRTTCNISIPVIVCGGASTLYDFELAIKEGGASAVAAGRMFVFNGPHKAVLISYPKEEQLEKLVKNQ